MSATAAEVARLRRMVAEPTNTTYSDEDIADYIERHPKRDRYGEPVQTTLGLDNSLWTATYDLNAAAAEIWDEKAAALADTFDTSIDGAALSEAQLYEHACKQARRYRSYSGVRSAPMISRHDEDARHRYRAGWETEDTEDVILDGLSE